MKKVTFWKFVSHKIDTTAADAAAIAEKIERRELIPMNNHGERFYKLGGYCYDIGRKPFLVQYAHGSIERQWALSVKELRQACYLRRDDKVVPDPFYKEAHQEELAA